LLPKKEVQLKPETVYLKLPLHDPHVVGPSPLELRMAPPLFADLFKTSNDLFVKDYKDLNPKLEATIGLIEGAVRSPAFSPRSKFASLINAFDGA
jgi:hypothetical protein